MTFDLYIWPWKSDLQGQIRCVSTTEIEACVQEMLHAKFGAFFRHVTVVPKSDPKSQHYVELSKDRKIGSKKVRVKRTIGFAKTYKILERPMNDIETVLSERILFSCFMLCIMRPNIVPENA